MTKLNLQDFLKDYGKYIGISFIISLAFLLVALTTSIFKSINGKKFRKKIKEQITKDILYLDYHEKALLREFYINSKYTLQLPMDNDTVAGLANKRIIYQASNTGFTYLHVAYFPYSMTEIAKENLTFKMIDLPENPTEDDKQRIWNERPSWAKERTQFDNRFNLRW